MSSIADIQTLTSNPERWEQVQARFGEILARSSTDLAFRAELMSDPRAALGKHLGREIPQDANIRFVDAQGVPTFVLPEPVEGELSEGQLEAVAGGLAPLALFAIGFAAAAIGDALF